jgi:hypothetical protein
MLCLCRYFNGSDELRKENKLWRLPVLDGVLLFYLLLVLLKKEEKTKIRKKNINTHHTPTMKNIDHKNSKFVG